MTLLSLVLFGCAPEAEPSPPDVNDLCRSLLRGFESDDVAADVELLGDWVDGVVDADEPGYELELLEAGDVAGLTFSEDLALAAMNGAVVPYRARGALDAYAAAATEPDQSFADDSYDRWDRTIVRGTAADYLDGAELGVEDEIEKTEFFKTLPYRMVKDFRWVELERGTAQLMRSVIPEEGWDEDGKNGVIGGFTVEVWYPDGSDGTIWVNATWTAVETEVDDFVTDEDYWVETVMNGAREVMEGTEAHVNGEDR